jgi:hypothetical protein
MEKYMKNNIFIIITIFLFGASAFASKSVEQLSRKYVGFPYGSSPSGEGVNGIYDKDPMINTRIFDCTTFVETIMLEYISQFENGMSKRQLTESIRYIDRVPTFLNRNHFISLDWLPNNNSEGHLKEITADIFPRYYKTLTKVIDKDNWFEKYHKITKTPYRASRVDIDVITLDRISKNPRLIDRIPSGSVISFVTYQNQSHLKIPFKIHVLHQGLLVRKNGKAYIRHASNKRVGVIEELATKKLRKTNSFESININKIMK